MCGYSTEGDPDFDDGKGGDPAHIVDSPQPGAKLAYNRSAGGYNR